MPVWRACFIAFLAVVAMPVSARAQAVITGTVRDASGAVLPGVTVEAASPALIERVRSAVTDGTGQYRIVDLRPGVYAVTFTLQGFTTVKREGVELTGTFTASINAEMQVGTVTETVTVAGESPVVDVTSARRQTTLTSELLTTAPTARSWAALTAQIPTMTTAGGNNQDIQVAPAMIVFGGAGGRGGEGRLTVDGITIGATIGGGGSTTYILDISNAEEVVTTNFGGLGESEVNGPTLNVVPRTGGNAFKGSAYLSLPGHLQSQISCSPTSASATCSRAGALTTCLGNPTRDLVRVTEQCAAGCAANGGIAGLTYHSANWQSNWAGVHNWRASLSHVTGAHNRKFGYIWTILIDARKMFGNSLNLIYRLNNGVPNGVTQTALPLELHQRTRYDAFYAQEQWTIRRMTLQGALRFDHAWSYFQPETLPASNYLPFTVSYPKTEGVRGYKDLTPRFGVAYDVFGDAKTAVKFHMGKYLEASSNGVGFYSTMNPINRLTISSGVRTWNDRNGNF